MARYECPHGDPMCDCQRHICDECRKQSPNLAWTVDQRQQPVGDFRHQTKAKRRRRRRYRGIRG